MRHKLDYLYRWRWVLVVYHAAITVPIILWLVGCVPDLMCWYGSWLTGERGWNPCRADSFPLHGVLGVMVVPVLALHSSYPDMDAGFLYFVPYIALTVAFITGVVGSLVWYQKVIQRHSIEAVHPLPWQMALPLGLPAAVMTFALLGIVFDLGVPPTWKMWPFDPEQPVFYPLLIAVFALSWFQWARQARWRTAHPAMFKRYTEGLTRPMVLAAAMTPVCLFLQVLNTRYPFEHPLSFYGAVGCHNCVIFTLCVLWWTLGALGYLLFRWPAFRAAESASTMTCSACGYDLRGTLAAERCQCPECGAAVAGSPQQHALAAAHCAAVAK